jgi:alcohol dehydrogenase (cytochrome c)
MRREAIPGRASPTRNVASTWGMPGSYDPVRRLIYWGVANPSPYTRLERHDGNVDAVPRTAPADLYSNSTVALDPDTGELVWYYQHNPGEEWDLDYTNERTLLRTVVDPDPDAVKWINPNVQRGEERDIAVTIGEPGGLWALDAGTGEFLWATPFPFDVPEFHIADVETGNSYPNFDLGFQQPGERHLVCFHNTRSYWATAFHPGTNSLYAPYLDNCLDMTAAGPDGPETRLSVPRPGADPDQIAGLAKIDMTTGEIDLIYSGAAPGNGAVLATAGNLVFWGDLAGRFRAFNAETGEVLWQTILGGPVQNSTIAYGVDGTQYVAVMTGEGLLTNRLIEQASLQPARGHNAMYVFALPEE